MPCLFLRSKKKVVVIPQKPRPKRPKRALTIAGNAAQQSVTFDILFDCDARHVLWKSNHCECGGPWTTGTGVDCNTAKIKWNEQCVGCGLNADTTD